MEVIDPVSRLELASTLCAASAVAYKAAFMLAANAGEERECLDHCTARYVLLEGLLAQLHGSLGAAQLRDFLARLDADPSCYADRDHALTAARANDRELNRVLADANGSFLNDCPGAADQVLHDARPINLEPACRPSVAGDSPSGLPLHDLAAVAACAATPFGGAIAK